MLNIIKFIHLLSIVVWVGMIIFFSFFVAPSIFKVLPREAAGDLVGDIFPKYWAIGYISGVLGLLTLLVISFVEKSFPAGRIALITIMTVITFYSGLVVSAKARELKAQVRVVENSVTKEALQKEFRRLHFWSSLLNAVVLILGIAFIFFTSRSLRL